MQLKASVAIISMAAMLHATTLKEAVQAGLKYDPAIAAETQKYHTKVKSVELAESGYYPKVDLYSGIGYENTSVDNRHSAQTNGRYTRKEASARLRQPIFDGYATLYDVAAADAEKEASLYALDAYAQNKSLKIVKAYLDVLKMQDIVVLAKKNLDRHQRIMHSIQERYSQGVSNKADLIQIRGRVKSAETNLFVSQNNLLDAQAVYFSVVGNMPKNLASVKVGDVKIPGSLHAAIAKAHKDHPTSFAARKNVEVQKDRREGTKSGFYPHLYGDMSANYEKDASGIPGVQRSYQAMVRAEWNVFNGFKDERQHEIAQIEVLRAADQFNDTQRELELETRLSWNAYKMLHRQMNPLKEHTNFAKEATRLYLQQYDADRRSLIDVLNAQVEYFNAKRAYIAGRYDEIAAKYRILNSMGILNRVLGVHSPK